ncbi:hypothetical protein [Bradyrhizobium sp. BWA-3-5]|uniref:hypothetical protein n=1 Tax=Bradyrhizobium sp. BWA-3-5 TaxID=3080013 RepID=UPI00293F07B3|nr:hypothetical protein [Bradyrhizobium sp. BWA-3-5]WOH68083.1 hypothetical protein RX331_10360 [Bradyrhizobium sp. BWA-3-5]
MKNTVETCLAERLKRLPLRHRIAHLRAPQKGGRRDEVSSLLRQEMSAASAD